MSDYTPFKRTHCTFFPTFINLGVPDLFVTFTCNPEWKEIKDNIGDRQPWEAVDLIVRVFREKLKELLDDIQHKGVLGSVKGIIWVIEYQKRGLPHAHILVILHNKDKAR